MKEKDLYLFLQGLLNLHVESGCSPLMPAHVTDLDCASCSFFVNGNEDTFGFDLGAIPNPSFPEVLIQAFNYAQANPSSETVQNTYNYNVFWRDIQVNYGPYPAGGLAANGFASLASNTTVHKPAYVMPN